MAVLNFVEKSVSTLRSTDSGRVHKQKSPLTTLVTPVFRSFTPTSTPSL